MNLFKRLTALLLATVLIVGLIPVSASASDHEHLILETSFVNPLYEGIVPEDVLLPKEHFHVQTYDVHNYTTDIEVAAEALREGMKNREELITVHVFDTVATQERLEALAGDIFAAAVKHTGESTEGDYLLWQWGGCKASAAYTPTDGGYNLNITFNATYYTTAAEEQAVDHAVEQLLKDLNVDQKSDYEKIKAVYDYICENVTYDHAHLNDETYVHQFTAYAALIDGTAVCQGYAVLLYRLALELGVDARLISGIGNGGPHGWNIIEMEDLYYNADSTWDAGQTEYSFFLKSPTTFPDHTRDKEYETNEFHKEYPMGSADYVYTAHIHSYTETVTSPTCTEQGYTTYTCECGDILVDDYVDPLGHTEVTDPRVEPTCSNAGLTEGSHCSVCNEVIVAQEVIPTIDHTPDAPIRENVVDATCSKEGSYDTVVYCSVCDQEISRTTYTVEKKEHTPVTDPRVEPSCSNTGLTEGSHCSVCNEVIVAQEVIPTIDHTPDAPIRENVTDSTCSKEGSYDTVVYCSVCDQEISRTTYTVEKKEHTYQDGACIVCGDSHIYRVSGDDRIGTALSVAAALKDALEVEKFDAIILAAAGVGQDQTKFADALSGSYLAISRKAPILLYTAGDLSAKNLAFIEENLSDNGVIYLLGGNVSIPAEVEAALNAAGYTTKRLKGDDRYLTNLAILNEVGVAGAKEVLIAGGQGFADSLSASATGLPILLVNGSKSALTAEQIEFLKGLGGKKITILGGNAAVSAELEAAIEEVVGTDVERIFGDTREETSVMVAERYFGTAKLAFITYSRMYPDGLAGGVLANVMGAPLLLTNSGKEDIANAYIEKTGIEAGCVLGGSAVITDETAKAVFGLPENAVIENAYFAG